MQRFFIFILLICCSYFVRAQNSDSTVALKLPSNAGLKELPPHADSLKIVKAVWMTPKKVALFSGILPGLGQAYNHQYWKIPIIYAGFGVAGYIIAGNLKDYNAFRQIYAGRVSGDNSVNLKYPLYADYSNDVIKNAIPSNNNAANRLFVNEPVQGDLIYIEGEPAFKAGDPIEVYRGGNWIAGKVVRPEMEKGGCHVIYGASGLKEWFFAISFTSDLTASSAALALSPCSRDTHGVS